MNDNETVEKECEVLLEYPKAEVCDGSGLTILNNNKIADRILAAHKREMAERDGERNGLLKANDSLAADNTRLRGEVVELRECLRDAVLEMCHDCIGKDLDSDECKDKTENADCFVKRWRAALAKAAGESEAK